MYDIISYYVIVYAFVLLILNMFDLFLLCNALNYCFALLQLCCYCLSFINISCICLSKID